MKTEASEYLSLLQEIQNNNVSTFTVMPADEPRFTIETNSRNIIVPSEFSFLSVQNDHRAETIYFEIDRYFDNVDLSQHACVVQFINKSGTTINEGTYPVTSMDIDSVDGKIVFGWEIRNDATQLTGDITFSVRFYSIDNNGNFTYNFNTLTANSYILPSLNIIASGERITATELEVWTDKMNNLASSIESDIITVEEKIEELENYIASIPEDYTALTEEVSQLSSEIEDLTTERTDNLFNYKDNNQVKKWFINTSNKQIVANDECCCIVIPIDFAKGDRVSIHKVIVSRFVIGVYTTDSPTIGTEYIQHYALNDSDKLATFTIDESVKSIVLWVYYASTDSNNVDDILKSIMVNYGYYNRYEPYFATDGFNQIPKYYNVADKDFNSEKYIENVSVYINGSGGGLQNAPRGIETGSFFFNSTIISNDDTNKIVLQKAFLQMANGYKEYVRYVAWNKVSKSITNDAKWFDANNSHKNNKMCVAGDSITAGFPSYIDGQHWWETVGRTLNYDVAAIAQTGAGVSYWRGTNGCKIAKDTDFSNYDVCVFAFGTNDYGNNVEIGALNDTYTYSEDSTQTFYSSLKYIVETVKSKKPEIVMIFSLPINRKAFVNDKGEVVTWGDLTTKWCYEKENLIGKTLNDYCVAIIDVCNHYGIPYIDHRNGAFDVFSISKLLVDGLHPTEKGYEILGQEMSAKISNIIMPYVE